MLSSQSPIQYVLSASFLSSVLNTLDAVIFADHIVDAEIKAVTPGVFDRDDTQMGFSLGGVLHQQITDFNKVLLIVYHTPIIYLYPLIQALQTSGDTQVSILNLGSGISGLIHKGQPEKHDISLMHGLGITSREVMSESQLLDTVTRLDTVITYTRVADLEILPEMDIVWTSGYHSIADHLSATKTIICAAQLAGLVMSSMSEEEFGQVDMIAMYTHLSHRDDHVVASVRKTEQLTIIIDADHRDTAVMHAQSQCYLHGLGDIDIQVVSTELSSHHTILSEYFWEGVSFS